MKTNEFYKDPDAILDYQIDWNDWLDTDTISGSIWVIPSGLTEVTSTTATGTTTVWLSGGTAGYTYECVNHIETTLGRIDERTIYIIVENK